MDLFLVSFSISSLFGQKEELRYKEKKGMRNDKENKFTPGFSLFSLSHSFCVPSDVGVVGVELGLSSASCSLGGWAAGFHGEGHYQPWPELADSLPFPRCDWLLLLCHQ